MQRFPAILILILSTSTQALHYRNGSLQWQCHMCVDIANDILMSDCKGEDTILCLKNEFYEQTETIKSAEHVKEVQLPAAATTPARLWLDIKKCTDLADDDACGLASDWRRLSKEVYRIGKKGVLTDRKIIMREYVPAELYPGMESETRGHSVWPEDEDAEHKKFLKWAAKFASEIQAGQSQTPEGIKGTIDRYRHEAHIRQRKREGLTMEEIQNEHALSHGGTYESRMGLEELKV